MAARLSRTSSGSIIPLARRPWAVRIARVPRAGDRLFAPMSDIFISYARSTAAKAQQVADALRALGYEVWRDDELPAHRAYGDVIEERLTAAKAVVVIMVGR